MDLYRDFILDHYQHPRNSGRLKDPGGTAEIANELCGDTIVMDIKTDKGRLKDLAYMADGCAISVASASILSEHAKGKSIEELKQLTPDSIVDMLHVDLTPTRLKCALLPLEALHSSINNYLKNHG